MKNYLRISAFLVLGTQFISCTKDTPGSLMNKKCQDPSTVSYQNIENRVIVTLKSEMVSNEMKKNKISNSYEAVSDIAHKMAETYGLEIPEEQRIYSHAIYGYTMIATPEQMFDLQQDPRVYSAEPDVAVTLNVSYYTINLDSSQVTPYGITRVGGAGNGAEKRAWILDTGIDPRHPDLNVNNGLSKAFISGSTPPARPNDENGHGSHMAGIIGAKNNNIGTVGVAAGCDLVSVRVLRADGGGLLSDFIAGLDYIYSKGKAGEVVSISLGMPPSDALDAAVLQCANKGMFVAMAAGNSASNVNTLSPARLNATNVYTVSAMDSTDNWASFSNYGSGVDYCQPGVDIISSWKSGGYAVMTGTSPAAPHLAGILLLNGGYPNISGYVSNDPDSIPDPIGYR